MQFSKFLYNNTPDFLDNVDQCSLISNDILRIFDFDTENNIKYKYELLTNWTCKQNKGNIILTQEFICKILLSIIYDESPLSETYNESPFHEIYGNYLDFKKRVIRSLYNIMVDSIEMRRICIQNLQMEKISNFFTNYPDPSNTIFPELMKLMSIIFETFYYYPDISVIDDKELNDFISKSLFRLTSQSVHNADKYDYYVFSNFIALQKENLDLLVEELKNIHNSGDNIFNDIEYFDKKNVINIISILKDIFIEFIQREYDPSILQEVINLGDFTRLFKCCFSLDIDQNPDDFKIINVLFKFAFHFFKFCTGEVDYFLDKKICKFFVKYLGNGSYNMRQIVFNTLRVIISNNDANKQILIDGLRMKNNIFLALSDLLDSENSEEVEQVLKFILDLLHNGDEIRKIKVVRMMLNADNIFQDIDELMNSEEQTETINALCKEISEQNNPQVLYCTVDEFSEEEDSDSNKIEEEYDNSEEVFNNPDYLY